jgi:hypothetical protein
MNPDSKVMKRINQRDGTEINIIAADGIPLCPHCGQKMDHRGDVYENSNCPCWWKGANDANYYAQVVISDTSESEFAFRSRQADNADASKKEREEKLAEKRLKYAVSDAQGKFWIVHEILYLFGKRNKSKRNRLRSVIEAGADFDQAISLSFPSDKGDQ